MLSVADALQAASARKGQAILMSSVILCIGFGIMVLSRFVPIIHFGLLSAIIMITALAGDLVVLPAIMMAAKKGGMGKKLGTGMILCVSHLETHKIIPVPSSSNLAAYEY